MPVTATEGTHEPTRADEDDASEVGVPRRHGRGAGNHRRMRPGSGGYLSRRRLRRLPARRVHRHDRASLLRGTTCLLVWQPMVLPGRWPLESLQPRATSALPTAHARSTRATHLRAVPRASRRWAFRGQTRPSTLNEGSGASGARLHQELAAWYGLRPNAQRNPQDFDETWTTRLGQ
jgi:hypothetical protein